MRRNGRTATGSGALALVIMLAGCGAPGASAPSGAPSGTGSTSSASPDIPSPSASAAADPADPSTWLISDEGMGPVRLGDPFGDAGSAVEGWRVDPNCAWTSYWNAADGSANAYFASDGDDPAGPVTTVSVDALPDAGSSASSPRTAEGLGLGSTDQEVLAVHPDAVEQEPTIGEGRLLRVDRLFFTFREGESVVSGVAVTTRNEPPYEVCG